MFPVAGRDRQTLISELELNKSPSMIYLTYTLLTLAILFLRACTAIRYVIYPLSPTDTTKCTRTTRSLTLLLGGYNIRVYSSTVRKTTEFWLVQANDEQKAQIVRLPFVSPNISYNL